MAITRTAKGTNAVKSSQTTLTISGVSLDEGGFLIVGLAYENSQGAPSSVKWGKNKLRLVADSRISNAGMSTELWRTRIRRSLTRDIIATWASSVAAKAMFATLINGGASAKDVQNTRAIDATGSPATGAAVTTTEPNTIHIAAFGSKGPNSDTAGTAGLGHTLGQRVGTAGAPPVSNVTIQETYEILTATGDCRATLSDATSRDWASTIVAFAPTQTYTVIAAYERPWTTDTDSHLVIFRIESETSGDVFEARIDPETFDDMTDQEVTDWLCGLATWHADHHIDGTLDSPTPDSARATRLGSFVDDEVSI